MFWFDEGRCGNVSVVSGSRYVVKRVWKDGARSTGETTHNLNRQSVVAARQH